MQNKNKGSDIKLLDINENNLFVGRKTATTPKEILDIIGVGIGQTVADFGCGVGYFILDVAKRVGEGGKVIAIDIDRKMLDAVKDMAINSGLRNIYGVEADLQVPGATKMDDESADLVLIINLLYFVEDKKRVLEEAARILKKGGRMAIMEWSDKGSVQALTDGKFISTDELKKVTEKMGLRFLQNHIASISHEVTIFEKIQSTDYR